MNAQGAATTSASQLEEGTQELRKRESTHWLSSFPEFLSSFFRIGCPGQLRHAPSPLQGGAGGIFGLFNGQRLA
ncbi:MAG: hypothetical protein DME25_11525 [Verrucomicrobia bacterium]|nr:MAG: hypothetical protein DME25_11525 [Verrucomicrobiota bacterium]